MPRRGRAAPAGPPAPAAAAAARSPSASRVGRRPTLVAQPGQPSGSADERVQRGSPSCAAWPDRRVAVGAAAPRRRARSAASAAAGGAVGAAATSGSRGPRRPACPGPGAGTKPPGRAARRSRPRGPAGAARRRRAPARRTRRRRACAAACRRCRAARRPRGRRARRAAARGGAATRCRRARPRAGRPAQAAPHERVARRPRARSTRGERHAAAQRRAGTSLAECTARSISPRSSASSIVSIQRALSLRRAPRSPPVVISTISCAAAQRGGDRAAPAPAPARCRACRASPASRRRSGRTSALGGLVRLARLGARRRRLLEAEQLAQRAAARPWPAAVLAARLQADRRLVQQPLHDRAGDRLDAGAVARARRSPSGRRSRPAPARRSRRRARAARRSSGSTSSWPIQRGEALDLLLDDRLGLVALGLADRAVARARRPAGRRCRRASRRRARAQAGSTSRGTAMSMSTQRRALALAHDQRELLDADDRVRRGGARRRRCRPRSRRSGSSSSDDDAAAEALGERPRALARGGWRRRSSRTPWSASAWAVSSLVSPAPMITTSRRGELADDVAGQRRRRRSRRWRAPSPMRGLGAHALAGLQRGGEQAVGQRPGRARAPAPPRRRA